MNPKQIHFSVIVSVCDLFGKSRMDFANSTVTLEIKPSYATLASSTCFPPSKTLRRKKADNAIRQIDSFFSFPAMKY